MLPVQCVESISCGSQRHLQCMACALMQHENVLKACEKLPLDPNQHSHSMSHRYLQWTYTVAGMRLHNCFTPCAHACIALLKCDCGWFRSMFIVYFGAISTFELVAAFIDTASPVVGSPALHRQSGPTLVQTPSWPRSHCRVLYIRLSSTRS